MSAPCRTASVRALPSTEHPSIELWQQGETITRSAGDHADEEDGEEPPCEGNGSAVEIVHDAEQGASGRGGAAAHRQRVPRGATSLAPRTRRRGPPRHGRREAASCPFTGRSRMPSRPARQATTAAAALRHPSRHRASNPSSAPPPATDRSLTTEPNGGPAAMAPTAASYPLTCTNTLCAWADSNCRHPL